MPRKAPPERRRALLLTNPASRDGGDALAAADHLRDAGFCLQVEQPATREDVARTIERRAGEVDCVIVAGGDGSINAALPALLRTGLPLGVLPLGTANDFARTVGLPTEPGAAADVIAEGGTRRVDVGLANGVPFLNVATLGLGADLSQRLTGADKRRWGRWSYALVAFRVLLKARPFQALILDRSTRATRVRTFQIRVGNGRYHGGGVPVRHDARVDDGRLDLCSLEVRAVWRLLLLAPALRRGAQGVWREVRDESCTHFEVRTRRPRPVNLDGDLLTVTPVRFEIQRCALQVYAPSPTVAGGDAGYTSRSAQASRMASGSRR